MQNFDKRSRPETVFSFKFDGGLASNGELNFYELSRSQYAAARLIYTLARYQETGRVLSKITEKTGADIRARAARENCFAYDALVFLSVAAAQSAINVPLEALFAMVWDRLSPLQTWRSLKGEAQLELKRLESKSETALSKEETKRLGILRAIRADEEVTKREALALAKQLAEVSESRGGGRIENLKILAGDLQCEITRENIIRSHQSSIASINDDDRKKLFGKTRRLVEDIGLPLRGSAEKLTIEENGSNVVFPDRERIQSLDETVESDEVEYLLGQMIQYNVENGNGKFRPERERGRNEFGSTVHFRVETARKMSLSARILDAMREKRVRSGFNVLRDKDGNIKTLILVDIDDEDL